MVDRSAPIALGATRKTRRPSASKTFATAYSVPAINKGGTPGDEPVVIEDHESVPPIATPVVPTPVMVDMPSDRKAFIEENKRTTDKETCVEISRIGQQGSPVYDPGIILGKIDDLWIRRFDNYRLVFCCHSLLRRSFKSTGALRPLAHNLDGIENIL